MNQRKLGESVARLILDIAPEASLELLSPDEDMREELDLDSIDFIRLLEAIDEEFRVNIPESDYAQVNTLQKLLDYIADQLQGE
jgi:acyl carrier protein